MADKLVERAQRRWRKLDGHHLIPEGLAGRQVPDGIIDETQINAADLPYTPPHPQDLVISPTEPHDRRAPANGHFRTHMPMFVQW